MKAYYFELVPCTKGDRCFDCTTGFHTVRVDEPYPETIDEAIAMILETLKVRGASPEAPN